MKRFFATLLTTVCVTSLMATDYEFSDAGVVSFAGLESATYTIDADDYAICISKIGISSEVVVESSYQYNDKDYNVVMLKGGLSGQNIFGGQNDNITKVTIGEYVENIGDKTFAMLRNLKEFISYAVTPPVLGTDVFLNSKIQTVYVPAESIETYKSAWGSVLTTATFVAIDVDEPTSVDDVEVESFRIIGRQLICDKTQNFEVYSITGSLIFKGTASSVELSQSGVYIVRFGNEMKKFICR